MHKDITGQYLDVGDVVVYTTSGDSRAPDISFGRIIQLREKSVKVQPLNPDLTEKQRDEGYWRGTGNHPYKSMPGYEEKEFVKTGERPVEPKSLVNLRPERVYILEKI